ncbi:MAG: hypothetical protein ABIR91_00240 [Candidatus Saccharimonadales bacterium]
MNSSLKNRFDALTSDTHTGNPTIQVKDEFVREMITTLLGARSLRRDDPQFLMAVTKYNDHPYAKAIAIAPDSYVMVHALLCEVGIGPSYSVLCKANAQRIHVRGRGSWTRELDTLYAELRFVVLYQFSMRSLSLQNNYVRDGFTARRVQADIDLIDNIGYSTEQIEQLKQYGL